MQHRYAHRLVERRRLAAVLAGVAFCLLAGVVLLLTQAGVPVRAAATPPTMPHSLARSFPSVDCTEYCGPRPQPAASSAVVAVLDTPAVIALPARPAPWHVRVFDAVAPPARAVAPLEPSPIPLWI